MNIRITSILALSLAAVAANAVTYTIPTNYKQGWFKSDGGHYVNNTNYITGQLSGEEYRSFFSFDLSSLPTNSIVTSVKMQLAVEGTSGADLHILQFHDVSTSAATLLSSSNSMSAYNDLGTGTEYGTFLVFNSDAYTTKTFDFNSATISAVSNAAGGEFTLGGTLVYAASDSYLFGYSGSQQANLVIEATSCPVPEPASMAALSVGGLALLRRRRRS